MLLRAFIYLAVLALAWKPALPLQAGPDRAAQKGKIVSVRVAGAHRYAEADIVTASGLHVGELVGRDELQAAADRLAQLGPFSGVRYHYSSLDEDLSVKFEVEEASTVPVSFDNFPWSTDAELTEALKKAVVLFDGTAPEQGTILDAMSEALQKLLATRGVHASVERTLLASPGDEGMMQQFKVVGASLKVSGVEFSDALATQSKRVQERLADLVGKPYSRYSAEVFLHEQVRPVYLSQGHLQVRFGRPGARFTGDPNRPLPDSVLVIVPIEPGPVYHWGGAQWSGNTVFTPAALDEFLGIRPGELSSGMKITAGWQRVQDEYGRRGYLDVKVEPQPSFDDAAQRVSFRVVMDEGPQYRMGELVITGLSLAAERRIVEAWKIQRGEIFDRVYFDEFLAAGIKQAFADYVVHYDEVGHWLRSNPQTRTVDVLLDFK